MTKTCSKCRETKPLGEFYKDKSKIDGLEGKCKECSKTKNKNYYNKTKGQKGTAYEEKLRKKKEEYARNKSLRERRKQYYQRDKERQNAKSVKRKREKRKADPTFRMIESLRTRQRQAIKGQNKSESTMELLGCNSKQARQHLENQFTEGMSWKNYGLHGWHVDHVIPCASFDLTDTEQQRQCFHYTNLQPLWAEDNLRKSDKLPHEL